MGYRNCIGVCLVADDVQLKLYRGSLEKAWEDGEITPNEHRVLENLRNYLNISLTVHQAMEEEVKANIDQRPGIMAYKAALEQAWLDRIITKDEKAILDRLRATLGITDEEQLNLEKEIKQKLSLDPTTTGQLNIQKPKVLLRRVVGPPLEEKIPSSPMLRIRKPAGPPQSYSKQENTPGEADAGFWLNQGEIAFNSSNGDTAKMEEAINYFNKAIEIEPLNYLAWSNKGLTLKIVNRHEDALMCYERALSLCPDHVNSWFNKAVLLGCMNRYEEASECYKKVLELEPEHELARRDLRILTQFLNDQKQL